jgi:hypothetical protein
MSSEVKIESYSDKSLVVRGDTKPHKDDFKAMKGKWNSSLTDKITGEKFGGWIFPAKQEKELREWYEKKIETPVRSNQKGNQIGGQKGGKKESKFSDVVGLIKKKNDNSRDHEIGFLNSSVGTRIANILEYLDTMKQEILDIRSELIDEWEELAEQKKEEKKKSDDKVETREISEEKEPVSKASSSSSGERVRDGSRSSEAKEEEEVLLSEPEEEAPPVRLQRMVPKSVKKEGTKKK